MEDYMIRKWKDPLGRTIALTSRKWIDHILPKHPYMRLRLQNIGETIQNPEIIVKERTDRLYYKVLDAAYLMIVIAKFKNVRRNADGLIRTAYILKENFHVKGEIEWTGI